MTLHSSSFFRRTVTSSVISLLFIALLSATPLMGAETGDSSLFLMGFNAYQKGDYRLAVDKLSKVLKDYPTTPLRDMTLFWLARSDYRAGDRMGAAMNMSRFLKEFPDHPLKETVEEELLASAEQYDRDNAAVTYPSSEPRKSSLSSLKTTAPPQPEDFTIPIVPPPQEEIAESTIKPPLLPEAPLPEANVLVSSTQGDIPAASMGQTPASEVVAPSVTTGTVQQIPRHISVASPIATTAKAGTQVVEHNTALPAVATPRVKQLAAKHVKLSREQKNKLFREQAIADYRTTIEKFPGTQAATEAAARLRKLGADVVARSQRDTSPTTQRRSEPVTQQRVLDATDASGARQTVTIEVEQFSDLTLAVTPPSSRPEAGKGYAIPVNVVNNGNGSDSFSLESGFPLEYAPRFVTQASETPLTGTPLLTQGDNWRGLLLIDVPPGSVDGQKLRYPIKAVSRFSPGTSRTSELELAVSAPLLRVVVTPLQDSVKQGEQIVYRMTLLNVGSAPVHGAYVRLDYPSVLELVSYPGLLSKSGSLVLEDIDLASGDSRELSATFRLRKGSPALLELICRGEMTNPALQTRTVFVSPAATVSAVSGVTLALNQERLIAGPGQVLSVPVSVTNSGNLKEPMSLGATFPDGYTVQFYRDVRGNGQPGPREAPVNGAILLAPDETQHFLMTIATPSDAADRAESTLSIAAESVSGSAVKSVATLKVTIARPLVELSLAGEGGRIKPGEIAIVDMTCFNRGSAVARSVSLESTLPAELELVATEPVASMRGQAPVWGIPELGAGEKRNFRVISRVRHGIKAGSNLTLAGKVSYEDHQGKRY